MAQKYKTIEEARKAINDYAIKKLGNEPTDSELISFLIENCAETLLTFDFILNKLDKQIEVVKDLNRKLEIK